MWKHFAFCIYRPRYMSYFDIIPSCVSMSWQLILSSSVNNIDEIHNMGHTVEGKLSKLEL